MSIELSYGNFNIRYFRILMPVRRHAFIPENIEAAWEGVGNIVFNPRRVLGAVKRKEVNVELPRCSARGVASSIVPKIPRTLSRKTRTVSSLVTRSTPASQKLKALLSDLSAGFQQTIADNLIEEESHRL